MLAGASLSYTDMGEYYFAFLLVAILTFEQDACQSTCTSEGSVQLVRGSTSYEGRVEIWKGGQWGTICDDSWDDNAARVVCRQLGLSTSGSTALCCAQFGEGSGPIHIDRVHCIGTERTLLDCYHFSGHYDYCDHREDASVRCLPSLRVCLSGKVRLVGNSCQSGRVEICVNNEWGTVCDDGWTSTDAKVVCRQLGFSCQNAISHGSARFGAGTGLIAMDDVACTGFEARLSDCRHTSRHNCGHHEDASVTCTTYGSPQLLPPEITLQPINEAVDIYSLSSNFSNSYSVELSPYSNVSITNNTFILSLLSDVIYNISLNSCDQEKIYIIGPCSLISPTSSYRVLHYIVSSSGLQTVSVRCDWEGEVVVMECTENGNWKSINQQINLCNDSIENRSVKNETTTHMYSTSFQSTSTECMCPALLPPSSTNRDILKSDTAIIIYGTTILLIIITCPCGILLGFFCGIKYSNSRTTARMKVSFNSTQRRECKVVEPIYEEVRLSDPNPAYIEPNPAYEEPNPAYEEPNPAYEEPNPAYEEPNPAYEEPNPRYEDIQL